MFSFHKVTLEDKDWMQKLLQEDGWYGSEYSFGINVLWGIKYHIEVAQAHDCCIVRYGLCGEYPWDNMMQGDCWIYSFPIGNGDKKAVLDELVAEYRAKGKTLIMNSVGEDARAQLLSWYPGQFLIEENRDYEDYIYDREKLATLSGRKMHNKRNHVARFKDAGEWSYEPLTDNNLEECKALCRRWVFSREDKWNDDMAIELKVLDAAFKMKDELGLIGGVLRQKGQVVAFCMGEAINPDVFVVHFEKALPEYQGAYPMINQQFVQHACGSYKYINREDDAGDPGLRRAKLSYYPEILLKKYDAKMSPVVFADRSRYEQDIIHIWQTCFGDDKDFIQSFLDHHAADECMLLYFADNKPVAMASFLPIRIHQHENTIKGRYVYAVATLPEYRGRGYAAEILKTAKEIWQEPLLLSPAEDSLYIYYQKQEFFTQYLPDEWEIFPENPGELKEKWSFEESSAQVYKEIRDLCFAVDGYVEWDQAAIEYALMYAKEEGGRALCVTHPAYDTEVSTCEDILLYETESDTLKIVETTLNGDDLKKAAWILLKKNNLKKAVYSRPGGMLWLPEECELSLSKESGYFNLCLGD